MYSVMVKHFVNNEPLCTTFIRRRSNLRKFLPNIAPYTLCTVNKHFLIFFNFFLNKRHLCTSAISYAVNYMYRIPCLNVQKKKKKSYQSISRKKWKHIFKLIFSYEDLNCSPYFSLNMIICILSYKNCFATMRTFQRN